VITVREPTGRRAARRWARVAAAALMVVALGAVGVVTAGGGEKSSAAPAVSGCFAFTVLLSGVSFPRGTAVTFTVDARNVSGLPCAGRACGGVSPSFEVRDLAGRPVYRAGGAGVMCTRTAPPPPIIPAGHSATWIVEEWDGRTAWQGVCVPGDCRPTRPLAPAGIYEIVWHLRPEMSASSGWFRVS
jgi:hypothetical protein